MTQPNEPTIQPHTYTHIEGVGYVCNDCGAHGEVQDEIVHYPTCNPGESDRWQQWYSESEDADDTFDPEEYGNHQYDGVWDDDPDPYAGTYSEE